jgi:hypothetical protein
VGVAVWARRRGRVDKIGGLCCTAEMSLSLLNGFYAHLYLLQNFMQTIEKLNFFSQGVSIDQWGIPPIEIGLFLFDRLLLRNVKFNLRQGDRMSFSYRNVIYNSCVAGNGPFVFK